MKYELFRKKLFNTKISLDNFLTILYNVRRIQYYIGDINKIDIEEIKESSIIWNTYNKELSNDRIINPLGNTTIKEENQDIKQLKVLRKKYNNK